MGEEEEQIGRMLHFFQDLSNFVDRINSVVLSIVQQLTSLYQARQRMYISTFRHVHLKPVFASLSAVIRVLMTLDLLVTENDCIVSAWLAYKKMMQVVRADPERFGWSAARVKRFEKLLVSLDSTVLAGAMFQFCVEADFEAPQEDDGGGGGGKRIDITDNQVFLDEFFRLLSEDLDENVSGVGHSAETDHRLRLMGTFGLYVLYRRLVPQNLRPDEKFYKRMWEVQMVAPCVPVCGKLSWFPADFLRQHAPPPIKLQKLKPSDPASFRREYLKAVQKKFAPRVLSLHKGLCQWCVRVHGNCRPVSQLRGAPLPNVLAEQSAIVVSGLLLCYRVRNCLEEFMSLHLALDASISRSSIENIGRCVEVLKGLQLTFHSHEAVLAQGVSSMMAQLKAGMKRMLMPLRQRLSASRKMDDTKIDVLAAVTLIDDVFEGCQIMSYTRCCVTELALRVVLMDGIVKPDVARELARTLQQIKLLAEWQTHVKRATDMSGLYWSREMLAPLFKSLYQKGGEEAFRIPYILAAFSDPLPLIESMLHEDDTGATKILEAYKTFVRHTFHGFIIKPLCRDIEKNLRLQIHAIHLQHMKSPNPRAERLRSLSRFLQLNQVRVFGDSVDVRRLVSSYLEKEFYELTVLALHDYKTYAEMRNLARENFGLIIGDSHLPLGSLNQGLDVLQIVRNIHLFVARYNYNMNAQIFVERKPSRGAKHLNTINTQSIATSIRTHGLGMLNTTINFTYQFLTKKFEIFTQFLFDENIKGYLAKERRWYKKHKGELDFRYPFDRALQFTKDIRKLGVTKASKKDGQGSLTYLDQFRLLITHVGNALGFVRMVRSAGMHFSSDAVKFVPDLENIIKFATHAGLGQEAVQKSSKPATGEGDAEAAAAAEERGEDDDVEEQEAVEGAKLSEETVNAAENLDEVLATLMKNFSEGIDYFQVLVQVFQQVMLSKDHGYLKNFYMIIPSLCINYVDTIRVSKDKMDKVKRAGARQVAYFSDDGFAIGIAYILAILKQNDQFESMHWFDTMYHKYGAEQGVSFFGGVFLLLLRSCVCHRG
jgi:WASH complex subunit 7